MLNSAISEGLLPAILRTLMSMPGSDTTLLNDELRVITLDDEQRTSTVLQEGLFWEEGDDGTQNGDNIESDEAFEFFINL